MDYIGLLNDNTSKVLSRSQKIREFLSEILDKNSFVETDVFLSGKSYLDGSDAFGEGVITGYATIRDYPVCVVAQNSEVLGGSLNKAHADKILKCIKKSMNTEVPLISVIDSSGARLGEGVAVLEGYAQIIAAAAEHRDYAPHIAIVKGPSVGLMGMYTALADFVFMSERSVLSAMPPLTLSENVSDVAQSLVGQKAYAENSLISTVHFKDAEEIPDKVAKIFDYLGEGIIESNDDPNRTSDVLNAQSNADNLLSALADKDSAIELFTDYTKDVKTYFVTINSLVTGLVVTNNDRLNIACLKKIKAFVKILEKYNIPLVTLVDVEGIDGDLTGEQKGLVLGGAKLLRRISLSTIPKISVVTGSAIGFGYVALVSKSIGFDYTLAFANARIAPISSEAAAGVIYAKELKGEGEPLELRQKLAEKYRAEEMNPFVSAKEGYFDNIIEPALLRPYVASALSMLS
ncbi:MAG: carboxyl transferase domain-containing protein, partial [Clostridia bacterium]|nr:carboxyl transferase domain-containing protein [Clostridia bacterium]